MGAETVFPLCRKRLFEGLGRENMQLTNSRGRKKTNKEFLVFPYCWDDNLRTNWMRLIGNEGKQFTVLTNSVEDR
jgi:hypothetical protein